jgi:hypothetical protein
MRRNSTVVQSGLRLAALLSLFVAVAMAGCGGQTARGRFVAQADAICKQVAARRLAANAALSKAGSKSSTHALDALAQIAPGVGAYEHDAVLRLSALKAPASMAQEWQKMLAGIDRLASNTTRLGADAKAKNVKAGQALLVNSQRVHQELTTLAARDGFTYCGRTS